GLVGAARGSRAEEAGGTDAATFLKLRGIDRAERSGIEAASEWNAAADTVAIRLLERLAAPAALVAGWREAADPVPAAGDPVTVADAFFLTRGRAIFVAPWRLAEEAAALFGRPSYDVVRLVDERGLVIDLIVPEAPRDWPRWQTIDQPAAALGLPLTTTIAPRPIGPATAPSGWPPGQPGLLMAAAHVAWYPDTPLGRAGMDYALFDSVVDGKKLVAGDTAAFFAMLGAVGRTDPAAIAAAAAGPSDVMPLIDPARKWFPSHRGDPVVIDGTALRARRIPIDEEFRRRELGIDHYWELFVFVETPLLDVDGRLQDSYPIVCCVRDLPAGMPAGERINERVRVPGFACKRYAFGFEAPREEPPVNGAAELERRQTTLVVGPRPIWTPAPPAAAGRPSQLLLGLAAAAALALVFGAGILYGSWSVNRTIRRSQAALPDRIDLPEEPR
ncbi:MAG: hypothetical protein RLZZ440_1055, partial [Planctomycetota bacterium]